MGFLATAVMVEGYPLYIEVTDQAPVPETRGPVPAGISPPELVARIELAGAAAGETCVALLCRMQRTFAKATPDEVTVEFGISSGSRKGKGGCDGAARFA